MTQLADRMMSDVTLTAKQDVLSLQSCCCTCTCLLRVAGGGTQLGRKLNKLVQQQQQQQQQLANRHKWALFADSAVMKATSVLANGISLKSAWNTMHCCCTVPDVVHIFGFDLCFQRPRLQPSSEHHTTLTPQYFDCSHMSHEPFSLGQTSSARISSSHQGCP
jgi:hypothetical protein